MDTIVNCKRCQVRCKVDTLPSSNAKMLRRSKEGLCVNCAVHDWLRNTYPPNILLAQSGPKILLFPHIQQQFAGLMRMANADAQPDEIGWQLIVDNWDLEFPNKLKRSPMNPVNQRELDEIATGERPGFCNSKNEFDEKKKSLSELTCITSFEQLNELESGLGDRFKKLVREQSDNEQKEFGF